MNDFEKNSTETPPKWRAWYHIGLGVVYLIFAGLMFYVKKFGSLSIDPIAVYGISILMTLYGVFRIWRGIADLKMINRQ